MGDAEVGDALTQGLGYQGGPLQVGLRKHDGELFAAIARCEIGGTPRNAGEHARNPFQALVAAQMPVAIVELLEMVDVRHDQRQWRAIPAAAAKLLVEHFIEAPAVAQAGQAVDRRKPLQLDVLEL